MDALLPSYYMNQPTWFYLSFLLIVAIYFRFMRVFSLRNLDLGLLLAASPGLLLVASESEKTQAGGHAWLFVIACVFLLRLFLDPILTRRPYLGQNLNTHGMGFLCFAVFVFLTTQAISRSLSEQSQETVEQADALIHRIPTETAISSDAPQVGVTPTIFASILKLLFEDLAAPLLAILAHVAVITGLWFVGRNLFGDKGIGLAMATLYMLLPCTAYNVGEFNHVLPAALITWAFVAFRKPIVSGVLLGLACGSMLFPVFLLPIWATFYGRKRAGRFVLALLGVAVLLTGSLALTSIDSSAFLQKTIGTINVVLTTLSNQEYSAGFWKEADYVSPYRLPVMVSYFLMIAYMTIWPRRRNIEVLLAQSAAAIIGTQLWYTQKGGVYLLWYIPLLLMVIFRPRLGHLKFNDDLEQGELAKAKPEPVSRTSATTNTASKNLQLFR